MGSKPVSVEKFSQLIGALYDASLDPQHWQRALGIMRELFAANYVTLILRPPDVDGFGLMVVASAEAVDYYNADYSASPFTGLPPDRVVTVDEVLGFAEWRRHPYYLNWCASYNVFHVMATDIRTADQAVYPFRITRPEEAEAFSPNDRQLCQQLSPHLRRALFFSTQLDRSESLRALFSQALSRLAVATIVLDRAGRILQMNVEAEQLLSLSDGLKVAGGRLEANYAADNRILLAAIRKAVSRIDQNRPEINDVLSVSRPSGKVSLGIVVQRVPVLDWSGSDEQQAAIVFVRDAESKTQASSAMIQHLFNLTPAETALAIELANGSSLEEAAKILSIRRNTARAHLRAIFSKTGVRRQTELVRIVLNSVVALGQKSKSRDV